MTESLLPPMTEVKVTELPHIALAYKFVGAADLLDELEELKKEHGKLPGMTLAVATAKNAVSAVQVRLTAKNISVAMKHGFEPDTQTLAMESRKDGLYLMASEHDGDFER